ncbi:MAG: TrmH family RNA methyltransferase [Cytophagales bacterium]|nr:TrmH family RNA methyltransferase [Cytophagales bacterium]
MRKRSEKELNRIDEVQFKNRKKMPIVVALDNVRSLHNVGAIFRCCDAFAVEKILLLGITGYPPRPEIEKTALGATQTVPWTYHRHAKPILEKYKKNYEILPVEQTTQSIPPQEALRFGKTKKVLVFGHEVKGISEAVLSLAERSLEIPQFGTKHSLNVSVSAGIVLWEAAQIHLIP